LTLIRNSIQTGNINSGSKQDVGESFLDDTTGDLSQLNYVSPLCSLLPTAVVVLDRLLTVSVFSESVVVLDELDASGS
jgi:hypothetical protein